MRVNEENWLSHNFHTFGKKTGVFTRFHTVGVFFENIFTSVILIVQISCSFEGENCASVKKNADRIKK